MYIKSFKSANQSREKAGEARAYQVRTGETEREKPALKLPAASDNPRTFRTAPPTSASPPQNTSSAPSHPASSWSQSPFLKHLVHGQAASADIITG